MIARLLPLLIAVAAGCSATGKPADAPAARFTSDAGITIPADLSITEPRICAALAVYELAHVDDSAFRGAIAIAALNEISGGGRDQDCAAGVAQALTTDFSQHRWQLALDTVDAVASGDYNVFPGACARANAVIPAAVLADTPHAAQAARAQCVIHGLAFVEVQP